MAKQRQKCFDGVHDPDQYRELCVPFPDQETAADAMVKFLDGVKALRKEHKIPDVYVITAFDIDIDGETGQHFGSLHFGNQLMAEGMTAWAYGREQSARESLIGRALKSGRTKGEVRK